MGLVGSVPWMTCIPRPTYQSLLLAAVNYSSRTIAESQSFAILRYPQESSCAQGTTAGQGERSIIVISEMIQYLLLFVKQGRGHGISVIQTTNESRKLARYKEND